MTAVAQTGLSLMAGWDPGDVGWGDDVNENFLKLSALTQARVRSRVTSLPGSGTANDIYIVPSGGNADLLAIWDTAGADWYYHAPTIGTEVYLLDEEIFVYWGGSAWTTRPVGNSAVSRLSANYTFSAGDFHGDKIIYMDSDAAQRTLTIPLGLSVTEPVTVIRAGVEKVTIAGAPGVTVHSADNIYTLRTVWSGAQVLPLGMEEYVLIGDLGSA